MPKHALYLYQQQTITQQHNIMANLIKRNGETMHIQGTTASAIEFLSSKPNVTIQESRAYRNAYTVRIDGLNMGSLLFEGETNLKEW